MGIDKLINSAKLDREILATANAIRQKSETQETLLWKNEVGFQDAILSIQTGPRLGFNVIRGYAYPTNPSENTILVNTDVDISKCILSDDVPTDTTEGCLWVQTGVSGAAKINVVLDGSIVLHFQQTKQRIDGSWANVISHIYSNGEWIKTSTIPYAYQRVEYLESSGTQWIDTGYVQNSKTEYDITYEWKQSSSSNLATVFGTFNDAGDIYIYGIMLRDSKVEYNFRNGNVNNFYQHSPSVGTKHVASFHNGILTVNNSRISVGTVAKNSDYPIALFASYFSSKTYNTVRQEYFGKAKIYTIKFMEDGKAVRDMIPCYRKSDGLAGMYDVANDVFYINQGSGTFIVGADVYE